MPLQMELIKSDKVRNTLRPNNLIITSSYVASTWRNSRIATAILHILTNGQVFFCKHPSAFRVCAHSGQLERITHASGALISRSATSCAIGAVGTGAMEAR